MGNSSVVLCEADSSVYAAAVVPGVPQGCVFAAVSGDAVCSSDGSLRAGLP